MIYPNITPGFGTPVGKYLVPFKERSLIIQSGDKPVWYHSRQLQAPV